MGISNKSYSNKEVVPYGTIMHPKFNEIYNLYKRFVLLSGECKTRQVTQEELDKYKHLLNL